MTATKTIDLISPGEEVLAIYLAEFLAVAKMYVPDYPGIPIADKVLEPYRAALRAMEASNGQGDKP